MKPFQKATIFPISLGVLAPACGGFSFTSDSHALKVSPNKRGDRRDGAHQQPIRAGTGPFGTGRLLLSFSAPVG